MILIEDEARSHVVKELTRLLEGAPQNPLRLFFGPHGPQFSNPDFLWSQLSILFASETHNTWGVDRLTIVNYFMEHDLIGLLFQFILDFPSSTAIYPKRPLVSP